MRIVMTETEGRELIKAAITENHATLLMGAGIDPYDFDLIVSTYDSSKFLTIRATEPDEEQTNEEEGTK